MIWATMDDNYDIDDNMTKFGQLRWRHGWHGQLRRYDMDDNNDDLDNNKIDPDNKMDNYDDMDDVDNQVDNNDDVDNISDVHILIMTMDIEGGQGGHFRWPWT